MSEKGKEGGRKGGSNGVKERGIDGEGGEGESEGLCRLVSNGGMILKGKEKFCTR